MTIIECLKILSDSNRLRILNLLYGRELCVCELEYILGISQSNLSKHLRLMSDASFLRSRRENKFVYYQIDEAVFSDHPFVATLFSQELKQDAFFAAELKKLTAYHHSGLNCHQISARIADGRQAAIPGGKS